MVSVCLPSGALLPHLSSYLGFSYLRRGVSLHRCSSKAQLLLLTLDEGYLLTTATPDLECGVAPLGPPVPAQPPLLGCGVAPPGHRPWPQAWGSSSWLLLCCHSPTLSVAAPDLRRGVAPLGPYPIPAKNARRAQTKPCAHHDPYTPQRLSQTCFECLSVSCRVGVSSGLPQRQGLWLQHTWLTQPVA